MLYYSEAALSPLEVPEEKSLCIYISGCLNHCKHCHYPELQCTHYGTPLKENYEKLLQLYLNYCTCVCFLGEGENTKESRLELTSYAQRAHSFQLNTCLYSGRDTEIEPWMHSFDYIKTGSWKEALGPLYSPTTNQRLYKKINSDYTDITKVFWKP